MSDDNSLIKAVSDSSHAEEDGDWTAPLWDDDWEGEFGHIGEVHLCVAAKRWEDGTVDVLIAHYPEAEDGMPTAYAHRHGNDVTPLAVHGPANEVVETVTRAWGPPQ